MSETKNILWLKEVGKDDPRTISTRLRKTTDGQECGASKGGHFE